ncbi:MAG TPA: sigma-70 family RNA polymerase sigma factor [Solirubrobacteraceae bacterium]
MSPATLRRYRAERLLREEFEGLRARVTAAARGRLLASGVRLDQSDLDACYAQAWQGLYTAVLDGHQIVNPAGWLVLVTFRRAIEEHRSRSRLANGAEPERDGIGVRRQRLHASAPERDLADELEDRIRLRALFEGMRGRLSARELQAATLCYLHGLTRAEAAERMGVSEARMRKLMEGHGPDRPGVAAKIGGLVETIREGRWCAEQASLMRGYAYGILDPDGERYRLARAHRDECPACRAYVVSLRGLAAVLPPVLPPWPLAASVLAGAGTHAGGGIGGALGSSGSAGAGGAGGAAGAGAAAGGGPMFAAGSLAAKLAAGCVLAVGVGVSCVALYPGHAQHRRGEPARASERERRPGPARLARIVTSSNRSAGASFAGAPSLTRQPPHSASQRPVATIREFRLEQPGGSRPAASAPAARAASVAGRAVPARPRGVAGSSAQREFGPG